MYEQRGDPTLVARSAAASDPETAKRLWELSEELAGVSFPLTQRPPNDASNAGLRACG